MHTHAQSIHFLKLFFALVLVVSGPTLASKPAQFGGPSGVSGELNESYEQRAPGGDSGSLKGLGESYFEWKDHLQEEHNLSFGLYGYWLYQSASDTLGEEDEGLGQIYRFLGSYNLYGKDTGHPGRIEWRFEHRSNMGSYLSPSQLDGETGVATLNTGFAYSPTFDTDLAVLNWTQGRPRQGHPRDAASGANFCRVFLCLELHLGVDELVQETMGRAEAQPALAAAVDHLHRQVDERLAVALPLPAHDFGR